MMRVDYLIIGAGLSGLVLRRMLDRRFRVVLVDPNPGGWKIGEANVPEMFASPIFSSIVGKARQLPSFSQKNGSVFIGNESIAIYPITSNYSEAMHVARDELEQLLAAEWDVQIERERVEAIDIEAKVVRTDRATYDVEQQILDCSGPAMLVAQSLGDVRALWPTFSSWRYYDVEALDPAAFFRDAESKGKRPLFIDIPNIRVLPSSMRDTWMPHEATNLTKVRDGVWMWQIPLFGSKMLSLGLVSRHGPVTLEELDDAAARHHAPSYVLRPRPLDESSVYNRLHLRSGFARRAGCPATASYILVGDAFMFVDPIYSVGTSIAVNKALELAVLLNEGGWTPAKCAAFCARYEGLIARRTIAFEHWYSEKTRSEDADTRRVMHYFPEMTPFQAGVTWQYAHVVAATLRLTRGVQKALALQDAKTRRASAHARGG